MRGKWVLLSVAIVLLGVLGGAVEVLRTRIAAKKQAEVRATRRVTLPPVEELSLPARIEAQRVVTAGEEASGNVQEFLADIGQEVYEGQVLARMTSEGLQTTREMAASALESAQDRVSKIEADLVSARMEASRARAEAIRSRMDYEKADRAYQRQKMLHENGATPRLVFEKSERDFRTAEAEFQGVDTLARQAASRVEELGRQLDNTKKILEDKRRDLESADTGLQALEVHAPTDGLVVGRRGEVGRPHQPGSPMFEIAVDLANLQAVLDVDPSFVKRISLGQPAMVFVADVPEGLAGTVRELRAGQVVVAFTSPNPVVHPGMTAQVRIKPQ